MKMRRSLKLRLKDSVLLKIILFKWTDVYSHIIDEDRRRNAELFEEAFYEKKNLDPKMHDETTSQTVDVPDDVDAELLAKVLANPEMKAFKI